MLFTVLFFYFYAKIITDQSPDSVWTGFVSYIVGIVLLMFIGRWKENCGLDSDEENDRCGFIVGEARVPNSNLPPKLCYPYLSVQQSFDLQHPAF